MDGADGRRRRDVFDFFESPIDRQNFLSWIFYRLLLECLTVYLFHFVHFIRRVLVFLLHLLAVCGSPDRHAHVGTPHHLEYLAHGLSGVEK